MSIEPFTAEREWTEDGIPVLRSSVSLPLLSPETSKTARRFHRYYQLQCRSYFRYCEKLLLPQAKAEYRAALSVSAPLPCFQADLTYHITYHDASLLSLYIQSRETTVAGPPHLTRRSDTWNLETGYPVSLSDLLPNCKARKRQLLNAIAEEIQRREKAGASQFRPDWPKMLRRHFNSQNFYLAEDGLVIFFPMYTLASAAERIPTFSFPCDKAGVDSLSPEK